MSSSTARPVAVRPEEETACEYVECNEKDESFHQEAMKSWEEYKATGLHITGDELIGWLKTWGTEHEQDAPICHR